MNTAAMLPLSLQTHLSELQPQPVAIAVNPKGFKAALQSFIQFLIAHQVPATLWLKLPKDDAWWQDIWQYGQQAAGCTIYSLGEQTGNPPKSLAANLRPIPIEQTSQLKREFLCIAVADNFVGGLFATRAESKAGTSDKRTLKLYGSTEPSTIAAFSKDIKAILESNIPSAEELKRNLAEKNTESGSMPPGGILDKAMVDEHLIAGAAALCQWDRYFPSDLLSQPTTPLSGAFFAWQLERQEKLRSQLSEHRSLAKNEDKNSAFQTISADFLSQAREALQSPLTTIKTALTLLGSPTLKLAQRQRYLEMITSQCEQQKALINSIVKLLELQTTRREEPQALKLSDLIPGIVSTYQPLAEERGIMLAYTVPDSLPSVCGVEAELKQILIHLIKNGIHTTPQNGKVWVAARRHSTSKFVVLTIQDSGNGIAPADIPKLFEAFAQSPSSRRELDTSLGLTLVQQLVQRMDGSISVECGTSQGTTFKILLPIYQLPTAVPSHRSQSQAQPQQADIEKVGAFAQPSQLNNQEKAANNPPNTTTYQSAPDRKDEQPNHKEAQLR